VRFRVYDGEPPPFGLRRPIRRGFLRQIRVLADYIINRPACMYIEYVGNGRTIISRGQYAFLYIVLSIAVDLTTFFLRFTCVLRSDGGFFFESVSSRSRYFRYNVAHPYSLHWFHSVCTNGFYFTTIIKTIGFFLFVLRIKLKKKRLLLTTSNVN